MARYFQVLQLFWATAIAAELEYRLNFPEQPGRVSWQHLWAVSLLPNGVSVSVLELGASLNCVGHLYPIARFFQHFFSP